MKKSKTTIISNESKDLFRIHFYENCIKFDIKFAEAISKNSNMCMEIFTLNRDWVDKKIKEEELLTKIAILVENNASEFESCYFKDYELNKHGKYVDLVPIDSKIIDMGSKANEFYLYLLKQEVLNKITKKKFEIQLVDELYKDLYVENYSNIHKNKRLKYYQYKLNDNFERKTCNIIASDKEVFFGYTF